jgi:hypothetical protein
LAAIFLLPPLLTLAKSRRVQLQMIEDPSSWPTNFDGDFAARPGSHVL